MLFRLAGPSGNVEVSSRTQPSKQELPRFTRWVKTSETDVEGRPWKLVKDCGPLYCGRVTVGICLMRDFNSNKTCKTIVRATSNRQKGQSHAPPHFPVERHSASPEAVLQLRLPLSTRSRWPSKSTALRTTLAQELCWLLPSTRTCPSNSLARMRLSTPKNSLRARSVGPTPIST